jgi:hypothetical protein
MDKFIADFIFSEPVQKVSSSTLRVYLLLRADVSLNRTHTSRAYKKSGELISGLDVQSIAEQANEPPETVKRILSDLVKRGWIRIKKAGKSDRLYHLGVCPDAEVQWFVDGNPSGGEEPTTADTIRSLAEEARARKRGRVPVKLSPETKKKIGREIMGDMETGIDVGRTHRRILMDLFKNRYRAAYSDTPDAVSEGPWGLPTAQANSYVKRFYDWCGGDVDRASSLIGFLFDNWDELYAVVGGSDKPSLNFLGSKVLFGKLQLFASDGIPKPKTKETTARRHDKKASEADPDVGW